ncbi:MAG: apolipoprotein N-acyltransferase [Lentisphaerae bacterium]|nr:apolipoprotein N-acyltransferase [Lentisphaerota bacterium]
MKIFHVIKRFFSASGELEASQKPQISRWKALLHWLVIFAGGVLMAAAFPPLNLTLSAFLAWAILFYEARNRSPFKAALAGWVWGMGYALCAFFWLREINWAIPWGMMVVLGAYYIPVGWMSAIANRYLLLPPQIRKQGFTAQSQYRDFPLWRQLAFVLVMGAVVVFVEYLRHSVLPWNFVGVAFYRNAVMMQLVRYTGIYGLTMLAVMLNASLMLACLTVARKDEEKGRIRYYRPWPLLIVLLLLALNMACGIASLRERRKEYASFSKKVRLTLVQGQLSQRRGGNEDSGMEALQKYAALTRTQIGVPTDLVVWPETAVNYPLRGNYPVSKVYRQEVRTLSELMNAPLLLGTLEFDISTNPVGMLNSAVLTDTRDVLREGYIRQYDKVHPVPFGEYVPMRKYLPEFLIKAIDMNRDLTPGKSLEPIQLNEDVRLGMNICFEDVFSYISRTEAVQGADMLLVITNDAWYPTSSEPEQHLANSVARSIENNLPMVRCGNDSATCLITPGGEIIWSLADALKFEDGKPFRRGAGAATITVNLPDKSQKQRTFYSRYGDWLVYICIMVIAAMLMYALQQRLEFLQKLQNKQ